MKKYIIIGAGEYGKLTYEKLGEGCVECFVDNNKSKIGTYYLGKEVKDINFLYEKREQCVLIIAMDAFYIIEIEKQLKALSISNFVFFFDYVDDNEEIRHQRNMYMLLQAILTTIEKNDFDLQDKNILYVNGYLGEIFPLVSALADSMQLNVKVSDRIEYILEEKNYQIYMQLLLYIKTVIEKQRMIAVFFRTWTKINQIIAYLRNKTVCNKLCIGKIDWMITERCSLKCEECLNLMQYYESPQNYSLEEIKKVSEVFFKHVDSVLEVRLLGGEPLMNPEFYEICQYFAQQSQVQAIIVFTNATIPLKEKELKKLNKQKIFFYISDYGLNNQIVDQTVKILTYLELQYYIEDYRRDTWIKHSEFEEVKIKNGNEKKLFEMCRGRDCPVILKDKFFICEYLANAINIQAIPDNVNNYVEIKENENLEKEIKDKLQCVSPLPGCFFCSRWLNEAENKNRVKAAKQTKIPLKYRKWEK